MLDDARHASVDDGDLTEFAPAGAPVDGRYRCCGCGYGVTVHAALPRCPMCAGETWERTSVQPLAPHRLL